MLSTCDGMFVFIKHIGWYAAKYLVAASIIFNIHNAILIRSCGELSVITNRSSTGPLTLRFRAAALPDLARFLPIAAPER